jgi:hypothetical protein
MPCLVILEARRTRCPQTNSQTSSSATLSHWLLIGVIRIVRLPSDWGSVGWQENATHSPRSSTKSIYTWQRLFSRPKKVIKEVDAQADEIRRLKRDLARVTSGRDILKKAVVSSMGQRNGSIKGISRCLKAKRFSRPCIEPQGNLIKVALRVYG